MRDRIRVQKICEGPSMAQQHFKDECDINKIMDRWQKTGIVEHVKQHGARYGDFTQAPTYQESVNMVIEAQEAFNTLPSTVRKRFDNDPAAFLTFMADKNNAEEMKALGLLEERPQPQPKVEEPAIKPEPEQSTT